MWCRGGCSIPDYCTVTALDCGIGTYRDFEQVKTIIIMLYNKHMHNTHYTYYSVIYINLYRCIGTNIFYETILK